MFTLLIFAAGWLETPAPIEISELPEGGNGVAPLVLTNSGDRTIKVTHLSFEGDPVFRMDTPQKLKIKPGATVNVLVSAEIDEPGFYAGTVRFDAGDEPMSVPVSAWTVGYSPNAGILGALSESGLEDLFGSGSRELSGGIGGLIGAKGTPTAEGGLGARPVSTEGGLGSTTPKPTTHNRQGQTLTVGDPIILGALDKAVIDGVIAADLDGILGCYSSAKATNSGRVTVKFTIDTSGKVSATTLKATTLNDPAVEGCVLEHVGAMRFPSPQGGGIVIASYPFNFSAL